MPIGDEVERADQIMPLKGGDDDIAYAALRDVVAHFGFNSTLDYVDAMRRGGRDACLVQKAKKEARHG